MSDNNTVVDQVRDRIWGMSDAPATAFPEIHRPLDTDYEIPGRGNNPHGVDSDTESVDYYPTRDTPDRDLVPYDTPASAPVFEDVVAPVPVPVVVVPDIMRSVVRRTRIHDIYGYTENLDPTVAAGVIDRATIRLLGKELGRTTVELRAVTTPVGAATSTYVFAVASNATFRDYVILGTDVPNIPFTVHGTDPVYVALIATGTALGTSGNTMKLVASIFTETKVDDVP